jgi:hypothetical protein
VRLSDFSKLVVVVYHTLGQNKRITFVFSYIDLLGIVEKQRYLFFGKGKKF